MPVTPTDLATESFARLFLLLLAPEHLVTPIVSWNYTVGDSFSFQLKMIRARMQFMDIPRLIVNRIKKLGVSEHPAFSECLKHH
jgi:hypothetical protein